VEVTTVTNDVRDIDAKTSRIVETGRQATAMLVGALVSGMIVGGVGARGFMLIARLLAPERRRIITEAGARVGEVTIGGSVFLIVFVGLFASIAIGWTLAVCRQWLGWTGRYLGLAVGVVLLLTFNGVVLDPDNFDFAVLGDQAMTVAMISILFIAAGPVAVWSSDRVLPRLPVHRSFSDSGAAYLPAILLSLVGLTLLIALLGAPGEGGLSRDAAPGFTFAALVVITIADRAVWIATGGASPIALRIAGYTATGAVAVIGLLRYVEVVAELVP
jgi:hypothetical protein